MHCQKATKLESCQKYNPVYTRTRQESACYFCFERGEDDMKLDLIQLKTYPLGNTGQDVHTVIYRATHSLRKICLLYCPYRQLQVIKCCPHKKIKSGVWMHFQNTI